MRKILTARKSWWLERRRLTGRGAEGAMTERVFGLRVLFLIFNETAGFASADEILSSHLLRRAIALVIIVGTRRRFKASQQLIRDLCLPTSCVLCQSIFLSCLVIKATWHSKTTLMGIWIALTSYASSSVAIKESATTCPASSISSAAGAVALAEEVTLEKRFR
jgi:hypothetical protein